MKKILAFLLAVALIVGFMPVMAKADNNGVTVYLSISNNEEYLNSAFDDGDNSTPPLDTTVMAFRKITVPYFDIGQYGLSSFYYNTNCYSVHDFNPSHQVAGTSTTANGHVTLLHVMIYALEVFYYGVDPDDAGQGFLAHPDSSNPSLSYMGTSGINITGTVGSLYFDRYWGMDGNLEYFVNYEMPVAYTSWGSTADQIEMNENDIISFGHFTDEDFFLDDNGIFTYAVKPVDPEEPEEITAETTIYTNNASNNSVELIFKHAFANIILNDTDTTKTPYEEVPVYYCEYNSITNGDIAGTTSCWTSLGDTDEDGLITISASDFGNVPGKYVVAIPGQEGASSGSICSTPGGIIVEVTDEN